jgi:hypothetical protein
VPSSAGWAAFFLSFFQAAMRQQIRDEFASIIAFDAREQADLALALA